MSVQKNRTTKYNWKQTEFWGRKDLSINMTETRINQPNHEELMKVLWCADRVSTNMLNCISNSINLIEQSGLIVDMDVCFVSITVNNVSSTTVVKSYK